MFTEQTLLNHHLIPDSTNTSGYKLPKPNHSQMPYLNSSPSSLPLRLDFKPSCQRKMQQLSRKDRSQFHQHPLPHRRGQSLPEYLHSASNDNLYPSTASVEHIAPLANDTLNADIEASPVRSLLPQDHDPNARPKCFRNIFEECIFVFTVMMATASTTFIQGVIVINTALIGKDLKMTGSQITWISAAVGLASGSFMLFFGKTADLFGCKPQLCYGMAFLSFISFITFWTPNPMAMNILCGFLGLGTAAVSPPAIGALFATYPEGKRRNKATGALGSGNPVGFILGSISSGLSTKIYGWRSSFIVICIFFFVMAMLSFWTMPILPPSGNKRIEFLRFDWLGTSLTITGMALLCAGLTEGPGQGWTSIKVLVMLVLGVLCLVGFAVWEHIYKFPLLNPSVWMNRNYTLCVLSTFFGYMSFITNQFWISLYMQQVQQLQPITIAVRLLPQAIAGIAWSYLGQAVVHRINGTILMGIGGLAYFVGALIQIFIRQHTSYWGLLFPALLITVLGADIQFIVSNLYISKQMPTQSALGAGVLQTAMRLSVSLGLAITTAAYISSVSAPEARKDITFAFRRAFTCSILFAVTGLLFVPFMRIGKQGSTTPETEKLEDLLANEITNPSRQPSNYRDGESQTYESYEKTLLGKSTSNSSITSHLTQGTCGSQAFYFPRWSWEDEPEQSDQRVVDGQVIYEVCIKCSEERKVTVQRDPYYYCSRTLPISITEPHYEYTLTPVSGGTSYSTPDSSYHDARS